jgi:hypothetical protein
VQKHIEALEKIREALAQLEEAEARQVIGWAAEYYGVSVQRTRDTGVAAADSDDVGAEFQGNDFKDIGQLFEVAEPSTEAERALVASYWLQIIEDEEAVEAQRVNDELKDLGIGIGNVTRAMQRLIERKPALIRQVSKSGTSRQGRKKFRLTQAGIREVQDLISGKSGSEE